MDRLTFDELEDRKKYLAARRNYLEMQSTVRKISQLLMNIHAIIGDYYSETSIRKGQTVCGALFSFRRHRFSSDVDSLRSSDLPVLVMNNMILHLSARLSKLEKISFSEYSRHKNAIDKILFRLFDDKSVDLRDISPENPLYGEMSPDYLSSLEEISVNVTEEELLSKSSYDIIESYLIHDPAHIEESE